MDNQSLVSVILLTEDAGDDDIFSVFKNITEQTHQKIDIIVMLPASLKTNFVEDGLKFCGDPIYKSNERALYDKYKFITYLIWGFFLIAPFLLLLFGRYKHLKARLCQIDLSHPN